MQHTVDVKRGPANLLGRSLALAVSEPRQDVILLINDARSVHARDGNVQMNNSK